MNFTQVKELDQQFVLQTYDRHPVLFVRGEGVYLIDDTGDRYLDFLSGIGVNALGYAHPALDEAIREQLDKGLLHTSNLFHNEHQAKLASKLCALSGMDKAFIANTGTEAWEGALKFSRLYAGPQRTRILAMHNAFHGRTFGSLSTTGQAKYREPFAPLVPGVDFVRFNDVADLESKMDEKVAAICLETVQGEGGVFPVTPEFLLAARELADRFGALLILDEIQCGLGRTGEWFAYQHYNVQADIVTVAKPIAGGVTLAAVLMTERVAACVKPGLHGTTFGGGPLSCAAGLAALQIMESDNLLANAASVGRYMAEKLRSLASRVDCIKEARSMGLMIGVELVSSEIAKQTVTAMLARKIIINRTHETILRFLPPYIIERKHVDEMLLALEEVLTEQQSAALAATSISREQNVGH